MADWFPVPDKDVVYSQTTATAVCVFATVAVLTVAMAFAVMYERGNGKSAYRIGVVTAAVVGLALTIGPAVLSANIAGTIAGAGDNSRMNIPGVAIQLQAGKAMTITASAVAAATAVLAAIAFAFIYAAAKGVVFTAQEKTANNLLMAGIFLPSVVAVGLMAYPVYAFSAWDEVQTAFKKRFPWL